MTMFIQILDIIRIALVGIAFFFGYSIGSGETYDAVSQLHFMIPVVIIAIAGISSIEGLFFGKQGALAAGNHALEAIRHKNYKWQNINRPFLLILLLAGFIYPVLMLFK
ncbi:MAG: hypothetical protein NTW16_06825 [Bacteroidetes bacterium]|nr:hypothetical protein [Bacteroidota bacterium]